MCFPYSNDELALSLKGRGDSVLFYKSMRSTLGGYGATLFSLAHTFLLAYFLLSIYEDHHQKVSSASSPNFSTAHQSRCMDIFSIIKRSEQSNGFFLKNASMNGESVMLRRRKSIWLV